MMPDAIHYFFYRHSFFKKITSLIVIFFFSVSNTLWSYPAIRPPLAERTKELSVPSIVEKIEIPTAIGTVVERYSPAIDLKSGQHPVSDGEAAPGLATLTVVHIQDAHGNQEAQIHTKKILEHLNGEHRFDLIFLEGAASRLDAEYLEFFNHQSLDQRAASLLLEEGVLGGTELFMLESRQSRKRGGAEALTPRVFGAENPQLYKNNLALFRAVMSRKHQSEKFLGRLKSKIMTETSRKFNKKLNTFFKKWLFYQDARTEWIPRLDLLKDYAREELKVDLLNPRLQFEWPQLIRFFTLREMEKNIPWKVAEKEKAELMRWAESQGVEEKQVAAIENFGKKTSRAMSDLDGLPPRQRIETFYEAAVPKGFRFEDYPVFSRMAGILILQSEIKADQLMKEAERLTDLILKALIINESEEALLAVFHDYLLLAGLLSLELVHEEYEKVTVPGRLDALRPSNLMRKAGEAVAAEETDDVFTQAVAFYEGAKAREQAMFKNMMRRMKALKKNRAVLVTGGFHAHGLLSEFQRNKIAYAAITPHISEVAVPQNYLNIMMREGRDLALKSSIASVRISSGLNKIDHWLGDREADYFAERLLVNAASARRSQGQFDPSAIPILNQNAFRRHGLALKPYKNGWIFLRNHRPVRRQNKALSLSKKGDVSTLPLADVLQATAKFRFESRPALENILLVENDAGVRRLLRTIIEDWSLRNNRKVHALDSDGYQTTAQILNEKNGVRRFDMALVDLWLPAEESLDILKMIKRHSPDARIIMTSASDSKLRSFKPFVTPFVDEFVEKPYTASHIAGFLDIFVKGERSEMRPSVFKTQADKYYEEVNSYYSRLAQNLVDEYVRDRKELKPLRFWQAAPAVFILLLGHLFVALLDRLLGTNYRKVSEARIMRLIAPAALDPASHKMKAIMNQWVYLWAERKVLRHGYQELLRMIHQYRPKYETLSSQSYESLNGLRREHQRILKRIERFERFLRAYSSSASVPDKQDFLQYRRLKREDYKYQRRYARYLVRLAQDIHARLLRLDARVEHLLVKNGLKVRSEMRALDELLNKLSELTDDIQSLDANTAQRADQIIQAEILAELQEQYRGLRNSLYLVINDLDKERLNSIIPDLEHLIDAEAALTLALSAAAEHFKKNGQIELADQLLKNRNAISNLVLKTRAPAILSLTHAHDQFLLNGDFEYARDLKKKSRVLGVRAETRPLDQIKIDAASILARALPFTADVEEKVKEAVKRIEAEEFGAAALVLSEMIDQVIKRHGFDAKSDYVTRLWHVYSMMEKAEDLQRSERREVLIEEFISEVDSRYMNAAEFNSKLQNLVFAYYLAVSHFWQNQPLRRLRFFSIFSIYVEVKMDAAVKETLRQLWDHHPELQINPTDLTDQLVDDIHRYATPIFQAYYEHEPELAENMRKLFSDLNGWKSIRTLPREITQVLKEKRGALEGLKKPLDEKRSEVRQAKKISRREFLIQAGLGCGLAGFVGCQRQAPQIVVPASAPEKGSPIVNPSGVVGDAEARRLIRESLAGLGNYIREGSGPGVHWPSGMPQDHVQIDTETGRVIGNPANYAAPSKLGVYFPFLLKAAVEDPMLEKAGVRPQAALRLMKKGLESLRAFQQRGEGKETYAGLFPWFEMRDDGTLKITKYAGRYMVPTLDNGQLSFALAAVAGAFLDDKDPAKAEVGRLADEILRNQHYERLINPKTGLLFAEWNLDRNEGVEIPGHVSLWTEWAIPIYFAYLQGKIKKEDWLKLDSQTFRYDAGEAGKLDMPQGYIFSLHELWIFLYAPVMQSGLSPVFRNYLWLHASHAIENNLPGFVATEYGPSGKYEQGGIDIAKKGKGIILGQIDNERLAAPYATALGTLIGPEAFQWSQYHLRQPKIVGPYGPVTAFTREEGASGMYTADSAFLSAVAWSGGVHKEIARYFEKRHGRNEKALIEPFNEMAEKIKKDLKSAEFVQVRQIPLPPNPGDFTARARPKSEMPADTVNIGERLEGGHWHGDNVAVPAALKGGIPQDQKWVLRNGEIIADYRVTREKPFAWLGTVVKPVNISQAKFISFLVPAEWGPEFWQIELKNNAVELAGRVNVRVAKDAPGEITPDGNWKRMILPVQVNEQAGKLDLNYFAISVPDPRFNPSRDSGTIRLRDIAVHQNRPAPLKGAPAAEPKEKPKAGEEGIGNRPIDGAMIKENYFRRIADSAGKLTNGNLANQIRDGILIFPEARDGWAGEGAAEVKLPGKRQGYQYVYLKVRAPKGPASFKIELKGFFDNKKEFRVDSKDWVTVEIRIEKNDDLDYFAVSDITGPLEFADLALSKQRIPGAKLIGFDLRERSYAGLQAMASLARLNTYGFPVPAHAWDRAARISGNELARMTGTDNDQTFVLTESTAPGARSETRRGSLRRVTDVQPKPKAVLFDFDGTLAETLELQEIAFGKLYHWIVRLTSRQPSSSQLEPGKEFLHDTMGQLATHQIRQMIEISRKKHIGEVDASLFSALRELAVHYKVQDALKKILEDNRLSEEDKLITGFSVVYERVLLEAMKSAPPVPLKGVPQMIKHLHQSGIRLYIGTGTVRSVPEYAVQAWNMRSYFDGIYGSVIGTNPFPNGKSDMLRKVKGDLQVQDVELVIFGDGASDMSASKHGGLKVTGVGITRNHSKGLDAKLIENGADFLIPGLAEWKNYLEPLGFVKAGGDSSAAAVSVGKPSRAELRMLVLSRREGEVVRIRDDIKVTVLDIMEGRVRLGIMAPNTPITRPDMISHEERLMTGEEGMLVLTRKENEVINIGNEIKVAVINIRRDRVRLGFEAPKEVPVHRGEVYRAIQDASANKEPKQPRKKHAPRIQLRRQAQAPPPENQAPRQELRSTKDSSIDRRHVNVILKGDSPLNQALMRYLETLGYDPERMQTLSEGRQAGAPKPKIYREQIHLVVVFHDAAPEQVTLPVTFQPRSGKGPVIRLDLGTLYDRMGDDLLDPKTIELIIIQAEKNIAEAYPSLRLRSEMRLPEDEPFFIDGAGMVEVPVYPGIKRILVIGTNQKNANELVSSYYYGLFPALEAVTALTGNAAIGKEFEEGNGFLKSFLAQENPARPDLILVLQSFRQKLAHRLQSFNESLNEYNTARALVAVVEDSLLMSRLERIERLRWVLDGRSELREGKYGDRVNIYPDRDSMGRAAAELGIQKIKQLLKERENEQDEKDRKVRIVFAAAPSQVQTIKWLVELSRGQFDWRRIEIFHMDEFAGYTEDSQPINGQDPPSFRYWLNKNLITPIVEQHGIKREELNINFIEANSRDEAALKTVAKNYAGKLAERPVDIVFGGYGYNGHVAFNDPPASFDTHDKVIVVNPAADPVNQKQQMDDYSEFFKKVEDIPLAVTISMTAMKDAKFLIMSVPGGFKANAIWAIHGLTDTGEAPRPDPMVPGTYFNTLTADRIQVFTDYEGASLLPWSYKLHEPIMKLIAEIKAETAQLQSQNLEKIESSIGPLNRISDDTDLLLKGLAGEIRSSAKVKNKAGIQKALIDFRAALAAEEKLSAAVHSVINRFTSDFLEGNEQVSDSAFTMKKFRLFLNLSPVGIRVSPLGMEAAEANVATAVYEAAWQFSRQKDVEFAGELINDVQNIGRRAELRAIAADYGEVGSWQEAFDKARELFKQNEIDAIGTVSLKEFQDGIYMAPYIRGTGAQMGLPDDMAYLDMLAEVSPHVYPGNVKFHLVKTTIKVSGPVNGKTEVSSLVIVYLRPGEQYRPESIQGQRAFFQEDEQTRSELRVSVMPYEIFNSGIDPRDAVSAMVPEYPDMYSSRTGFLFGDGNLDPDLSADGLQIYRVALYPLFGVPRPLETLQALEAALDHHPRGGIALLPRGISGGTRRGNSWIEAVFAENQAAEKYKSFIVALRTKSDIVFFELPDEFIPPGKQLAALIKSRKVHGPLPFFIPGVIGKDESGQDEFNIPYLIESRPPDETTELSKSLRLFVSKRFIKKGRSEIRQVRMFSRRSFLKAVAAGIAAYAAESLTVRVAATQKEGSAPAAIEILNSKTLFKGEEELAGVKYEGGVVKVPAGIGRATASHDPVDLVKNPHLNLKVKTEKEGRIFLVLKDSKSTLMTSVPTAVFIPNTKGKEATISIPLSQQGIVGEDRKAALFGFANTNIAVEVSSVSYSAKVPEGSLELGFNGRRFVKDGKLPKPEEMDDVVHRVEYIDHASALPYEFTAQNSFKVSGGQGWLEGEIPGKPKGSASGINLKDKKNRYLVIRYKAKGASYVKLELKNKKGERLIGLIDPKTKKVKELFENLPKVPFDLKDTGGEEKVLVLDLEEYLVQSYMDDQGGEIKISDYNAAVIAWSDSQGEIEFLSMKLQDTKPRSELRMRIFTRSEGQVAKIGNDIDITVIKIERDKVKVGIQAPGLPVMLYANDGDKGPFTAGPRKMLVFSAKKKDSFKIGEGIMMFIVETRKDKIRLGFEIDPALEIAALRSEDYIPPPAAKKPRKVLTPPAKEKSETFKELGDKKGPSPAPPAILFRDLGGVRGKDWWNAMEPARQALLIKFFGLEGREPVNTIPFDHHKPKDHYGHEELSAEENMLLIAKNMAPYVKQYLIHPGYMLGRQRKDAQTGTFTGEFVNLKDLSKALPESLRRDYGPVMLHPELPQDKLYVLKWEGESTPNGDLSKGAQNAIGQRPVNQGEELAITADEVAGIPNVIGLKFMVYVDASQPDGVFDSIAEEIKIQSQAAHRAGLLFFPEDLPAKTIAGKDVTQAFESAPDAKGAVVLTERGKLQRALWEAENPLRFARALDRRGIDYDAYKFTFPGDLARMSAADVRENLRQLSNYTYGRLVMMLSGGDSQTLVQKARMASEELNFVGNFAGRGIWQKSFTSVPAAAAGDSEAIEKVREQIGLNLSRGTAKEQYEALNTVKPRMPWWQYLGLAREDLPARGEERKAIEESIAALKDKRARNRESAIKSLGRLDEAAVPMFLEALKRDSNPYVQYGIAVAFSKIRPQSPQAVEALAALLDEEDVFVRKAAIYGLGQIGPAAARDPEVVHALERLTRPRKNKNEELRRAAQMALHKIVNANLRSEMRMLVLERSPKQAIILGDQIEITVAKMPGNRVRLAISAPGMAIERPDAIDKTPRILTGAEGILSLDRKKGERIKIGADIIVHVIELYPESVRLGIEAPRDLKILRKELLPFSGAVPAAGKIQDASETAEPRSEMRPLPFAEATLLDLAKHLGYASLEPVLQTARQAGNILPEIFANRETGLPEKMALNLLDLLIPSAQASPLPLSAEAGLLLGQIRGNETGYGVMVQIVPGFGEELLQPVFQFADLFVGENRKGMHQVLFLADHAGDLSRAKALWKNFLTGRYRHHPEMMNKIFQRVRFYSAQGVPEWLLEGGETAWLSWSAGAGRKERSRFAETKFIEADQTREGQIAEFAKNPKNYGLSFLQAVRLLFDPEKSGLVYNGRAYVQQSLQTFDRLRELFSELVNARQISIAA